jgi:hypothetical protein
MVLWAVLLAGLVPAILACDDAKDRTSLQPIAGSGGHDAGPGGRAGGGNGGRAGDGNGGAVTEMRDASPDAPPNARSCVVGTLEAYCAVDECPPSFAAARVELRVGATGAASIIVQRPCTATDGSPRVSVSAKYPGESMAFIYDAETERLVGVQLVDDLGGCPGAGQSTGEGSPGIYGEESPDCGSGGPGSDFILPAACGSPGDWAQRDGGLPDDGVQGDGGLLDGGPRADPHECILTP